MKSLTPATFNSAGMDGLFKPGTTHTQPEKLYRTEAAHQRSLPKSNGCHQ